MIQSLDRRAIHIWRCDLRRDAHPAVPLDEQEWARANAFVFPVHRQRFIAGRRFLKSILARYLGSDCRDVHLEVGRNGKPRLRDGGSLQFNASHCGDVYVLAVGVGDELGIDVETHRSVPDAWELGVRVFSEEEMRELAGAQERSSSFLTGWTRKEAFVKKLGIGVAVELRDITVGLKPLLRVVKPAVGISDDPVAIRSLACNSGEYLAVACAPEITELHVFSDAGGDGPPDDSQPIRDLTLGPDALT